MFFHNPLVSRYVGYLTFAVNYRLHGLAVEGYHALNIALHILSALLLMGMIGMLLRTPLMKGGKLAVNAGGWLPVASAALFLCHPLATEAVTYVFQRLALLAAFFWLLAIFCYLRFRLGAEEGGGGGQRKWLFFSFLSVILAMKSKENAFMLPFVMALTELVFFSEGRFSPGRRLLFLLPSLLLLPLIPVTLMQLGSPAGELLGSIEGASRGFREITRHDYLLTQFPVIAEYLRLFFLPVGLTIDHAQPLRSSFMEPGVFFSALLLLLLLFLALAPFLLRGGKLRRWRFPAYGLLWFFLALAIESSVIPIPMLMAEYRMYLPMAGLAPAVVAALAIIVLEISADYMKWLKRGLVIVLAVLCVASYMRNEAWGNGISLWRDAADKNPERPRVWNNLGNRYREAGRREDALEAFHRALKLDPAFAQAHNNLALLLSAEGELEAAYSHFEKAVTIDPDYAEAWNNLGNLLYGAGELDGAQRSYRRALDIDPWYAEAHNNLGVILDISGEQEDARRHFESAIELMPRYADAWNNFGNHLMRTGGARRAAGHYRRAIELEPEMVEARVNLAAALMELNDYLEAREQLLIAREQAPDSYEVHLYLGVLYLSVGDRAEAGRSLERAVALEPGRAEARTLLEKLGEGP